jgi:DNA-binding transcriptional ArsR family regulator
VIDIQKVLDALASPIRREILWLIWDAELPAGAISTTFHLTAPTISEHLAVLRGAGLVTMRAAGTYRYYRARRDVLHGVQSLLFDEGSKWTPADDLPERERAAARTELLVIASVEVPCDRETTYRGFTDPELYSRWLGVPVTIDADWNFACTMEWGTTVRGRYTDVCPPSLIALRWDFADNDIPIPGGERDGYIRLGESGDHCHVTIHQLVADQQQAAFMQSAWTMVLGRLTQGLPAATSSDTRPPPRRPRPKTHDH